MKRDRGKKRWVCQEPAAPMKQICRQRDWALDLPLDGDCGAEEPMKALLRTRRSLRRLPVLPRRYSGEGFRAPRQAGRLSPDNRSLRYEAQSGLPQYQGLGRRYSPVPRVEATAAKRELLERFDNGTNRRLADVKGRLPMPVTAPAATNGNLLV